MYDYVAYQSCTFFQVKLGMAQQVKPWHTRCHLSLYAEITLMRNHFWEIWLRYLALAIVCNWYIPLIYSKYNYKAHVWVYNAALPSWCRDDPEGFAQWMLGSLYWTCYYTETMLWWRSQWWRGIFAVSFMFILNTQGTLSKQLFWTIVSEHWQKTTWITHFMDNQKQAFNKCWIHKDKLNYKNLVSTYSFTNGHSH